MNSIGEQVIYSKLPALISKDCKMPSTSSVSAFSTGYQPVQDSTNIVSRNSSVSQILPTTQPVPNPRISDSTENSTLLLPSAGRTARWGLSLVTGQTIAVSASFLASAGIHLAAGQVLGDEAARELSKLVAPYLAVSFSALGACSAYKIADDLGATKS